MGMGMGSRARQAGKERGLADILGMGDFFIELHARFVRLMIELGVMMSS
jgi:hypothetical protein